MDFDGARALEEAAWLPVHGELPQGFIEARGPRVLTAIDRLCDRLGARP